MDRNLVFISGYYGFDNLGDEAILEVICSQLKKLTEPDNIVVLSANPQLTERRFGVKSMQRSKFMDFFTALSKTRLFISGGGGLFQNTRSLGSIIFYGLQILMAKANNVKTMICAQGIGPLKGKLAENICKEVFARADEITLRDDASMLLLNSWNLKGARTADPVWLLEETEAPACVIEQLNSLGASKDASSRCVGVSLRPSPELDDKHLESLALALDTGLDKNDSILLLALQQDQDGPLLSKFKSIIEKSGRKCLILDSSEIELPSQWLAVFARLKLLVGMRLHALLMTLKAGKPVIGIAYDPKVTQLLTDFEQCCLILTKEDGGSSWKDQLKAALEASNQYSQHAKSKLETVKNLSCQNFQILARILDMPRESGGS